VLEARKRKKKKFMEKEISKTTKWQLAITAQRNQDNKGLTVIITLAVLLCVFVVIVHYSIN
jgi:hypothetical protein